MIPIVLLQVVVDVGEVDFRIIVIAYDRTNSLIKCLKALQELELDGDRAVIDVFLDRGRDGNIHFPTFKAVSEFKSKTGPVNIHQQKEHVGIGGQWIDSWQPREDSKEICIILEDDIDLSKYAYRWLKAATQKYTQPNVGGFSLHEATIPGMGPLPDDVAFFHAIIGTHAFAPVATHWHDFRRWYHKRREDGDFHPYVDANPIPTGWYRRFEKTGRNESMWEQWYIRFAYDNGLFTVYSNLQQHSKAHKNTLVKPNTFLAFHREEAGLHFGGKGRTSDGNLITTWDPSFIKFPDDVKKYHYNATEIRYFTNHWYTNRKQKN